MAAPAVTITGTIQDIFGNGVAVAIVQFTLVNYGNQIPVVAGTSILGQVTQTATPNGSGAFTVTVYNNTLITPPGTYYVVSFYSSPGVLVRSVAYQFNANGTFDLSTLTPFNSSPTSLPLPNALITNPLGGSTQTIAGGLSIAGNLSVSGSVTNPLTAPSYVRSTHGDRHLILENPDFEGTTILPPPGWSSPVGGTTFSYETTSPAPGKAQSIKVSSTLKFGGLYSATLYSVTQGDVYAFSCMTKTDGAGGSALIDLQFQNTAGADVQDFAATTTSTSWTQLTGIGTCPAGADRLQIILNNNSNTQPSSVWFDQVLVQKINFPGGNIFQGRVSVNGVGVSSASVTGAGSTATVAIGTNSTDSYGELLIQSSGTGQASTGTITLNLSSGLGSSRAVALMMPMSTDSVWNARASFQQTNNSTSIVVLNWDNNGAALVAGNNYRVGYFIFGR